MGLISIIVPIYKVEKYLNRCIESILNQSYGNFELILVNDGSPDKCPQICDEWKQMDERIKVIHKENGGLSDARNAGLKVVKGEFIAFIDSDDWIAPDYLRILLDTLKKYNCDIVECNIICTTEKNDSEVLNSSKNIKFTHFETENALKELINDKLLHQYVWNKLYKSSVINNILFEKGKTNEDEFWTYQIFGNAKKIGLIDASLYYYFQRDTSIMGEQYSLKRLDALEAKSQRQKYIETKFPKLKNIAKINLFTSCIYQGQMSLFYLKGNDLKEAKKKIKSIVKYSKPLIKTCKDYSLSEKIWIFMAKNYFWGTCKLKNFLKKGLH